jgi:hypothetical protein
MNIISILDFDNWQFMVEKLQLLENENRFIFRGQTNEYDNEKQVTQFWPIISTFNRYYEKGQYDFKTFLSQQSSDGLFQSHYGNYHFTDIKLLNDCTQLERIYYLQHYGIPTCLLDFTYDSMVALYFAIAGVRASSGGIYNPFTGKSKIYPENSLISVYAIDFKVLKNILNIRELQNLDLFLNYDNYYCEGNYIALDLDPMSNVDCKRENYNLKNQRGSFILFDNKNSKKGLIDYLDVYAQKKIIEDKIEISEPFIYQLNLDYNSVLKPHSYTEQLDSLFQFLKRKKKTGKYLFNDLQGLKYDFNFFHN